MIEKFGPHKRKSDHSIFYRNSQASIILLVVYVDDIVITGNVMAGISSLKSFLHGQFHTKDFFFMDKETCIDHKKQQGCPKVHWEYTKGTKPGEGPKNMKKKPPNPKTITYTPSRLKNPKYFCP